ncbi:hypothetical protein LDO31_02890 [Luteimonas sp. XNQY3]|nr:hypothetical protein [Luteimonas sp. XNQY3]MCD9005193.1 hypothetical protein [Luteimonas sp. XNQY3]
MKIVTRALPCTPVINGVPSFFPFSGIDVGPLFVHRIAHDELENVFLPGWGVTHTLTGLSIAKGYTSKTRALRVARQLKALDCWGFSTQAEAKLLPEATKALIFSIREGGA